MAVMVVVVVDGFGLTFEVDITEGTEEGLEGLV